MISDEVRHSISSSYTWHTDKREIYIEFDCGKWNRFSLSNIISIDRFNDHLDLFDLFFPLPLSL